MLQVTWSSETYVQKLMDFNDNPVEIMKDLQFTIKISATKEKVWHTLWDDKTLRNWANIIDEGTYMVGEMNEGSQVRLISSVSGYGVTSIIEKLTCFEFVLFRHMMDTKEGGTQEREREWTGGTESYSLTEKDGVTLLSVTMDVPDEQQATFTTRFPRALKRVRILSEIGNRKKVVKK